MRSIVLFILIVSYFFIVTLTLTAMANDPLVQSLTTGENSTFIIDRNSTNINISQLPSERTSAGGFLDMAARMFTFRIPSSLLPNFLGDIVSFFNWLLIILLGIVTYRLASPATGSG